MNWFELIGKKRKLIISGIAIICLAMLLVTVRRNNISLDSFWHLKMGLDWLENGLSFWRDHYSFTFNGEEISSPPYIFQTLLGWLVMELGLDTGFEVYKLISFVAAFSLVLFFLNQLRSPTIIYCLVLPLLVVMLQIRSIVRPELISYGFSVLAIIFYYKANKKISITTMLPITVLMLVWTNYHTSIFGYIIFLGFFIDLALQQIRDRSPIRTWLLWLFSGFVVVAVGFLNPGFHHPVIGALTFSPEWKSIIDEYKSALMFQSLPAFYSLIVVFFVTVVLLLRNRQFGLFFVCLFLGINSAFMSRLLAPSGIVILCIFAWAVSEVDVRTRLQHMPKALSQAIATGVLLIFFGALSSSIYLARSYMQENRQPSRFPVDVANYMITNNINGRIFNDYGVGGYLIYRLSPESQVYIDGRTGILYPLEHVYRYKTVESSATELRAEIDKYDINLAVLENKQSSFQLAHDTGVFGLDFVGNRFSLFRRNNPNFPVIGTLIASPACWNSGMSKALENEQVRAGKLLPANSFLKPSFLQFMIDFTNAVDKRAFLSQLQVHTHWPDSMLRFAAYQALSSNLDLMASEMFTKVVEKEFSDYLGAALAQARLGDWNRTEQILDSATRLTASFKVSEIKILHSLLIQVRHNSGLNLFNNAYLERIAGGIDSQNDHTVPGLPMVGAFCPE